MTEQITSLTLASLESKLESLNFTFRDIAQSLKEIVKILKEDQSYHECNRS